MLPAYSPLARHWALNPDVVYLNHGSFCATPVAVQQKQLHYQQLCEAEAIEYFVEKLPGFISESKKALGNFVDADVNDFVFVPNTTFGVNTILSSFPAQQGDEWLMTTHNYGACVNAMKHYSARNNCGLNVAQIGFPTTKQEIIDAIEAAITPRTTLALMDYITSASAIIFPVEEIIALLRSKGIKVLIDAAHAPGMVPFSIRNLKPDFFVANCHKWICSPKGSAFMYVAPEHHQVISPLVISHYNDTDEGGAAHWANQFMFDGTHDYSAYFCVKDALEQMQIIANATWSAIMQHNHDLVWNAANKLASALDVALPANEDMVGSICNIPMPPAHKPERSYMAKTALKKIFFDEYKIEVPCSVFPAAPNQWLRISAQLYNSLAQYDYLIDCLRQLRAKSLV